MIDIDVSENAKCKKNRRKKRKATHLQIPRGSVEILRAMITIERKRRERTTVATTVPVLAKLTAVKTVMAIKIAGRIRITAPETVVRITAANKINEAKVTAKLLPWKTSNPRDWKLNSPKLGYSDS